MKPPFIFIIFLFFLPWSICCIGVKNRQSYQWVTPYSCMCVKFGHWRTYLERLACACSCDLDIQTTKQKILCWNRQFATSSNYQSSSQNGLSARGSECFIRSVQLEIVPEIRSFFPGYRDILMISGIIPENPALICYKQLH